MEHASDVDQLHYRISMPHCMTTERRPYSKVSRLTSCVVLTHRKLSPGDGGLLELPRSVAEEEKDQ